MGFAIPKQLQDELQRAVPHLRIILPAAAAVAWFVGRVFHGQHPDINEASRIEEDEGDEIDIEISNKSSKGPKLPFLPPPPMKTTLFKATYATSIQTLWEHLLSGKSDGLVNFHNKLGDKSISINQWRRKKDGSRSRVLRFTKPLQSTLGPKECFNTEILTAKYVEKDGFVVTASCTSQGVPFSSNFINYVQWVAIPNGPDTTTLHLTADCKFHTPVWGPLKGTISNESIKGMLKAYTTLQTSLTARFGSIDDTNKSEATSAPPTPATTSTTSNTGLVSYLQSSQSNPAVLLVIMAMFIVLWRMALMDTLALAVLRRLAAST